ncbi:leucine/isoleucine/valine transporter permease subunit [Serratia entomophila]|nr:leucine/isoleucine/valine transporter permease subunit [Serratia entomophila]CAI1601720.1 leucine/isoleucine/valine transporter permease subunit [Serratia entomophila]
MTILTSTLRTAAPRRLRLGVALFMLGLLLAPWLAGAAGGNYWVRVIDFALLYLMLALGLNIVVGFTGLLDMGFIAFYAVGPT